MRNYSKLFGAVIGAFTAYAMQRWIGFDVVSFGVEQEWSALAQLGVDAAITGFAVWLAPKNRPA